MAAARYFTSAAEFDAWLDAHHATESELLVGFHKVASGKPSMTWSDSVDVALCHGWIDGVRRGVDDSRYTIRFTPRKAKSIWSKVNIAKVAALTAAGRMRPAGLAAFARREDARSGVYSFEQEKRPELDAVSLAQIKRNRAAWKFFSAQPPYYRRVAAHYVTSAKKEETRARRLSSLIEHSALGERLPQFISTPKKR